MTSCPPFLRMAARFFVFCRLAGFSSSDIYVLRLDTNLRPLGEALPLTGDNRSSVTRFGYVGVAELHMCSANYLPPPRDASFALSILPIPELQMERCLSMTACFRLVRDATWCIPN